MGMKGPCRTGRCSLYDLKTKEGASRAGDHHVIWEMGKGVNLFEYAWMEGKTAFQTGIWCMGLIDRGPEVRAAGLG